MSIHEVNSHSLDFEKAAEQAAMDKVMDIHRDKSLKHGFVRFGPLVIEGTGYGGISDNRDLADPRIDRLRGILLNGLVSGNFAKRARIPISRNWSDPINKNSISLETSSVRRAFELAIGASNHNSSTLKIPRKNIYVILIGDYMKITPHSHISSVDVLREHRISPRFFKGIVFIDTVIGEDVPFGHYRIGVNYESSSVEQPANIVSQAILSICKKPDLAIPIYGYSGSLYWPKKMSYQEVQGLVKERRDNGI